MLDYIVKEKKLLQYRQLVRILKKVEFVRTWKELKYGNGKDHYYACHIVATVVVLHTVVQVNKQP
jgi:hypothetical protein